MCHTAELSCAQLVKLIALHHCGLRVLGTLQPSFLAGFGDVHLYTCGAPRHVASSCTGLQAPLRWITASAAVTEATAVDDAVASLEYVA